MILSLKTLLLLTFIIACLPLIKTNCPDPQKGFFLSYNALSKRDTMADVFKEIDKNLSTYSASYKSDDGIQYDLTNIKPQLYYNEHHQTESYIDGINANVSLGLIFLNLHFNYSIGTGTTKNQGYAQSTVVLEEAYFTKRIVSMIGYLEWDPIVVSPLFAHNLMYVKYNSTELRPEDKRDMELILNEHVGNDKIKTRIFIDINKNYTTILKKHLNNEELIGTDNINYKYKNVTYNFNNFIKNFTLHNDNAKGLEVFFLFELDGQTTKCTPDNIDFSFAGGVQEWYSLTTLQEVWKYALSQGILNVKLDKKWEVPAFQLYAGDLANSVPFLDKFNAELPIEITCKWTGSTNETEIRFYDHSSIMAEAITECTINFQGKDIVTATFIITYTIRIIAQENNLQFKLRGASARGATYKSLDPNYIVENEVAARYSIEKVLQGLISSEVLGTGWKTSYRRFPNVNVTSEYLIVFDPSER